MHCGAVERTQSLRALADFPENYSLILGTLRSGHNHLQLQFPGIQHLLLASHMWCTDMHIKIR